MYKATSISWQSDICLQSCLLKAGQDVKGIVECISSARFSKKKIIVQELTFCASGKKMNSVHCGCCHLNNDMQNLDSMQVSVTVNS